MWAIHQANIPTIILSHKSSQVPVIKQIQYKHKRIKTLRKYNIGIHTLCMLLNSFCWDLCFRSTLPSVMSNIARWLSSANSFTDQISLSTCSKSLLSNRAVTMTGEERLAQWGRNISQPTRGFSISYNSDRYNVVM